MSGADSPRKFAFLSYSHKDQDFARELHEWLEFFHVPEDLAGAPGKHGVVPSKMRPINRDRLDFEAGPSVEAEMLEALESSDRLIVVCSPGAAKSRAVNYEVQTFKRLGKGAKIYPIIVGGEPYDPERECFPDALKFQIDAGGNLTDQPENPIAADARPQGDGVENARLKLAAGLLGVDLDTLRRREASYQRRQKLIWQGVAGGMGALAVAAVASAGWGWYELGLKKEALGKNERMLEATLKHTSNLVENAVKTTNEFGVPTRVGVGLLGEVDAIFASMDEIDPEAGRLPLARAKMLMTMADSLSRLGKVADQKMRAEQALAIVEDEEKKHPSETGVAYAKAEALMRIAAVHSVRREIKLALERYKESLDIRLARLGGAESDNPEWLSSLVSCHQAISLALSRRGDPTAALEEAKKGLAVADRMAALGIDGALTAEKRASSLQNIADLQRQKAARQEALASVSQGNAIVERMLAAKPDSVPWLRRKIGFLIVEGDVHRDLKDPARQLAAYQAALALGRSLNAEDPQNVPIASEFAYAHSKAGEAYIRLADRDEAQKSFGEAAAIFEELRKAHPDNQAPAKLLIDALEGLGELSRQKAEFPDMQTHYERQLDVALLILDSDRDNRDSRRVVSKAHINIGDAHLNQGRIPLALAEYKKASAIARDLAAGDQANRSEERTLANALDSIGDACLEQRLLDDAIASYGEAIEIWRRHAKRPSATRGARLQHAYGLAKLANARLAMDDFAGALELADAALAIRRPLMAPDLPDDSIREFAYALEAAARAKLGLKDSGAALGLLRESLPVREKLLAAAESEPQRRRNLGETFRLIGEAHVLKDECGPAIDGFARARDLYARAIAEDDTQQDWAKSLEGVDASLTGLKTRCGETATVPAPPAVAPNVDPASAPSPAP